MVPLLNKQKVNIKQTGLKSGKKNKNFTKNNFKNKNKLQLNSIQGIIHIKSSLNNTIITLTDLLGNVKSWVSCGSAGFKGAKRSSRFAGQAAVEKLSEKIKKLGYIRIILHLNGLGRARNACIKVIKKVGLSIFFIKDFTPVPFNGCRPSKFRRL